MLAPNIGAPLVNVLLSSLPLADFDSLEPHMSSKEIPQGAVLLEPGEETDQVYFPHSGMLSLLMVLSNGHAIETATIGREGVVGAMGGLRLYKSQVRVVVQLRMSVSKIPAATFRKAVHHSFRHPRSVRAL